MKRNYTEIGQKYNRENIDLSIKRIEWERFKTDDLPYMQGIAIGEIIKECKIPAKGISRMALHSCIEKDGENIGFYGLDVKYINGQVQVYAADSGTEITILATDFTENKK